MSRGNPMGRPLKSGERRVKTEVYIPGSVLDAIGEYVAEQKQNRRDYSRSDFFNDAVKKHMTDLGLLEGDQNETN